MKILANDGISSTGIEELTKEGFTVETKKIDQDNLIEAINREGYVALLVRSATKVRKDLIDACPGLRLIGRGGVGMDNIDVEYARGKGIHVINTPAASSQSVAELVMGQLFAISRNLHDSAKEMPENGHDNFKNLKKKYADGIELRGKTLGIIGFGRIGRSLAEYALGCGMYIRAYDRTMEPIRLLLKINGENYSVNIQPSDFEEVLTDSDFISIHVPAQKDGSAVIGEKEFNMMKDGVRLVNAARGGVIDEDALLNAISRDKVAAAALDVYDNEPSPSKELLENERIACTPHIGAATQEAQDRIGEELAEQIIKLLK